MVCLHNRAIHLLKHSQALMSQTICGDDNMIAFTSRILPLYVPCYLIPEIVFRSALYSAFNFSGRLCGDVGLEEQT